MLTPRRALIPVLLLALVSLAAMAAPEAPSPWRFDGVARIVSIGDVHGDFRALVDDLRAAGLVDEDLAWTGGTAHLVMLGDLVDRGPEERKVLDLLMRLEKEAEKAGGQVHVLLGNHEVMNLVGDLRYVSKAGFAAFATATPPIERDEAVARFTRNGSGAETSPDGILLQFDELYPQGYFARRKAFSPQGVYGRWLLEKPFLIVINGVVYVHGGLPPVVAEKGLDALNQEMKQEIETYLEARETLQGAGVLYPETSFVESFQVVGQKLQIMSQASEPPPADVMAAGKQLLACAGMLVFRNDNPFWYRGTSLNPEAEEAPIFDAALARLGARAAVVGHTVTPGSRITSRFDGRLLRTDTGMLGTVYSGKPAALVLEGGSFRSIYPGEPAFTEIVAEAREKGREVEAVQLTDEQIEAILKNAEVVKVEDIGTGITRPQRVTLKANGKTRRAAFKTIDMERLDPVRFKDRTEMTFSDRYVYELAAYRLDRLLGMNVVPVTVERTIDGTPGSLQDWVENSIDERKRILEKLEPYDVTKVQEQRRLMNVFDVLLYNTDRNQTNMLYTPGDWKLHLIDHSRSFRLDTGRPPALKDVPIEVPDDLQPRLVALNEEQLKEAMKGLLSNAQIHAILKRRDKLVAESAAQAAGHTVPAAAAGGR